MHGASPFVLKTARGVTLSLRNVSCCPGSCFITCTMFPTPLCSEVRLLTHITFPCLSKNIQKSSGRYLIIGTEEIKELFMTQRNLEREVFGGRGGPGNGGIKPTESTQVEEEM